MTTGDPGLTAVPGVRVGHWTHDVARTGCTVVLAPPGGAVASGRVLGAAPGTRETALLDPAATVGVAHAVLLTGGSAFGLDAAGGVMAALEAAGEGVPTPAGRVPIVPAAVLYDLAVGRSDVRPGAAEGRAATDAAHDGPVAQGAVGAGTGATVAKL
ncbi:MAG: P1 family peptidase, partial [Trueperaceae bacterium]|nr:P1 family peptidase [Trueperaceae bacterium]